MEWQYLGTEVSQTLERERVGLMAAFNFPSSPTTGQLFTPPGGPTYQFSGVVWNLAGRYTAETRNRIMNPTMSVSEVNGDTNGTVSGLILADGWTMYNTTSVGVMNGKRLSPSSSPASSTSSNGSRTRAYVIVTTIDASVGTGEYVKLQAELEGTNMLDSGWGTASAKQFVLRFGWKSPAGTYSVSIRNAVPDRSYVTSFTIGAPQANVDTEQILIIPGDTSGTWNTNNTRFCDISFTIAAADATPTPNTWVAGSYRSVSGMTNGVGTVSNVFELFDVGFYRDPYNTNIPPPFEPAEYAAEIVRAQRYIQFIGNDSLVTNYVPMFGYAISTTQGVLMYKLSPVMRVPPTLLSVTASQWNVLNNNTSAGVATALATSVSAKDVIVLLVTVASGLTSGGPIRLQANTTSARLQFNAQM